jgi:hypothetical protein
MEIRTMELSITEVLKRAIQSIDRHFGFYAAITLLFFLLNTVLELLTLFIGNAGVLLALVLMVLSLLLFVKQAVVIHRSVILDEAGMWQKVTSWGRPDTLFLVVCLGLGLLYALMGMLISIVMMPNMMESGNAEQTTEQMIWVFLVLYGLVIPMVCLMLPSRAVGKPLSLSESITMIKPVYHKALVLMVVLPFTTAYVFGELLPTDSFLMNTVFNLIYQLVWVFEITVLSHTYQILIRQTEEHSQAVV